MDLFVYISKHDLSNIRDTGATDCECQGFNINKTVNRF